MSTFYSPRFLSFCIRAIFTPIFEIYTNKTHQLFDLQTPCLLCMALLSQPTGKNSTTCDPVICPWLSRTIILFFHSDKQTNTSYLKSVFLNQVRNQLWEPKFLRKQNRLRRPCINTSSNSRQHENTGKHHWGTGLKNCQG